MFFEDITTVGVSYTASSRGVGDGGSFSDAGCHVRARVPSVLVVRERGRKCDGREDESGKCHHLKQRGCSDVEVGQWTGRAM